MDNHCVICGAYLADTGRMVCPECEKPKKAELKPCPFCGGEAKVSLILGNYGVACTKCQGAVLNVPYQTRSQAIKAWNKRAASEELKFTREFIHEHGLDFALMSAWNRRAEDA